MSSARVLALRLLGRRDYTEFELREKLAAKEISADEIEGAVESLRADRLLDDRRTAAAHVRRATGLKHRGRLRIERELQARGVDRALIRELVAELSPSDETAAIEVFLQRRRVPARLTNDDRRRIFQQLMRRGFTADAIAKALKARESDPM